MEINDNNVQNQESRKKWTKGLSAALVIIILLTVLIIGIGGGYLLSKNDNLFNKNETQSNQATSNDNSSATAQTTTEMTADELKDLEVYLNKLENNGFVSYNLYKSINEIDIGMVFYNNMPNVTQEETIDFLNGTKQNTAITKVTMSEIKDRMYEKTGKHLTAAEIKSRMNWDYLRKYDAFYLQRGDSGYMEVKCQKGTKTNDGIYKVILTGAVNYEHDDNYTNITEVKDTLLTIKKEGDSYKFISHVINSYTEPK